jgi:hypothetical protein
MTQVHALRPQRPKTDYRLVLANLEKRILSGEDEARTRSILDNESIWTTLAPDLLMQWASLCRMAGSLCTAEAVYSRLHQTRPECTDAFERHMEMLDILGRSADLIRLLETARAHVPPEIHQAWARRFSADRLRAEERDLERAAQPFEALRAYERMTDRFIDLFRGRGDCFARQWADKESGKTGYVPVRKPMGHQDLSDHFKGIETCGIYLIDTRGQVRLGVIDADLSAAYREKEALRKNMGAIKKESTWMASRIIELSVRAGQRPLVEFSGGKGYHFWYFFDEPQPAGRVKAALTGIANQIRNDLSLFQLEVFPKQDHLSGQGFGNLVKLPLGIHRKTGKRSYFCECPDRDLDRQLAFLENVRPGTLTPGPENKAVVEIHPKFAALSEKWPDLGRLSSSCPPLGRLITAGMAGQILSHTEEQVLYQTLGFLPSAARNLHAVFGNSGEYNPHLVDLKISKLRGKPLGCKRIHGLLGYTGDFCPFPSKSAYPSPVLHLGVEPDRAGNRSEKVDSLKTAMDHLRQAMEQVERFLT